MRLSPFKPYMLSWGKCIRKISYFLHFLNLYVSISSCWLLKYGWWLKLGRHIWLQKKRKKNSTGIVRVQGLISFILFIIPEVVMSQYPENYNIKGCYSSPHSAQCTNTEQSHSNYSIYAWKCFLRYLEELREKERRKSTFRFRLKHLYYKPIVYIFTYNLKHYDHNY